MYGTIARLKVKPGQMEAFAGAMAEINRTPPPGSVAIYGYRMDADPDELYLAVVFESKEAYRANAESPETHADYLKWSAFLTAEPEWHDGEVIQAMEMESSK